MAALTLHDVAKFHGVSYQAVLKCINKAAGTLYYKGKTYRAWKDGTTWKVSDDPADAPVGKPSVGLTGNVELDLKLQDLKLKQAREKLTVQQLEYEKKRIADETRAEFLELIFEALTPYKESLSRCKLTPEQAQLLNDGLHRSFENLRALKLS